MELQSTKSWIFIPKLGNQPRAPSNTNSLCREEENTSGKWSYGELHPQGRGKHKQKMGLWGITPQGRGKHEWKMELRGAAPQLHLPDCPETFSSWDKPTTQWILTSQRS